MGVSKKISLNFACSSGTEIVERIGALGESLFFFEFPSGPTTPEVDRAGGLNKPYDGKSKYEV